MARKIKQNQIENLPENIGNLPSLTTTHKTDIVGAINEVNQKQSDVKIGGRNYILNSKNEREQNNSTINENYIIYDISTTNSAQLEPNTIYTLTADLWMTANVSSIDMFFVSIHGQHHSKNNIVLPAQTWVRQTMMFTTGNAIPHDGIIRFDLNGSSNGQIATLKTRLVKLEKGNKSTDWTPAPEDQYHENFDKLETVNQHVSIGSHVRFGDITATFGGAKIVYDVIENYGGVLKVNANGGLPLQLQNNGITTMQLEDYRVIINQKTFINRGLEVQGTSVNTDETKIFIVNQQNPKKWALSHGINNLSETTFSIGTYISGVYSWHMALYEGGYIETNYYGSSPNWFQGYNERVTQFNITATTNVYTFSVLLANGVQKQATLQTNATHFTINGSGVLQLNAAIAQKIADSASVNWVQGELDSKVNQGGTGHQGNPIFLGWVGSDLRIQVDNVFIGYAWHTGNFDPDAKADVTYVDAKIAAIPTHNGQLTVNTTTDLVGGYVYLPSGNLTTTLGLATHILNAIADGVTAYNWGNHATAGYTTLGAVQNWVVQQGFLTASALNGYVLQSSLTAQLANYVTLSSVQTITATKTYTVSPIVPNGTLNGHTVNLGQMQSYVTGLGYQTASQVTTIVNNAISAIPAPGNGSVILQGIGSLTGTATFSMNQSNNTVGSFDLTPTTKNEIAAGATAGVQIVGLFGDCQNYFDHVDVSAGGTIDVNETFYNLLDPHGAQPTVNVTNHHVHGARLILHSYNGVGSVKYIGEFVIEDSHYSEVNPENGQKMEFTWNEESQVWIYVLPN